MGPELSADHVPELFDNGADAAVQLFRLSNAVFRPCVFGEDMLLNRGEFCDFPEASCYNNKTGKLVHAWSQIKPTSVKSNRHLSASIPNPRTGTYTPVLPPMANLLLKLDESRASERLFFEAAIHHQPLLHMLKLFSHDGILRVESNPLKVGNQRPPLYNSAEHDTPVHHCTCISQPEYTSNTSLTGTQGELHVILTQLALYDHPLFGSEDRLYAQMRLLYGEYHRILKLQKSSYLRLRLQNLLDAVQRNLVMSIEHEASVTELSSSCFKTLNALALEQQAMNEIAEALYTTWNQLKGLRQHQRFVSTPAKLVAINISRSHQFDSRTMQPLLDHFHKMLTHIAQHASENQNSPSQERLIALFKRCRRTLTMGSDFVLKLYTTAGLTADDEKSLPVRELMRRRRVRQQHLYAILSLNGRRVATTLPQAVAWPTFTIQIEQPLRLIVARHPMKLKVEFWRRRLLVDIHLATILVPVPGISACHNTANTASLAPFREWLQFEVCQRQLAGAALVSLYWTARDQQLKACSYDPAVGSENAFLESLRSSDHQYPCGLRKKLNKDFPQILAGMIDGCRWPKTPDTCASEIHKIDIKGDPNDPRGFSSLTRGRILGTCIKAASHRAFRTGEYRHEVTSGALQARKVFHSQYKSSQGQQDAPLCELPKEVVGSRIRFALDKYKHAPISQRHRLLRLRMHQPALMSEPVPATDMTITTNALLQEFIMQDDIRGQRALGKQAIKHKSREEEGGDKSTTGLKRDQKVMVFVKQVQDSVADRVRTSHKSSSFPLTALVSEGHPLPQLRARGLIDAVLEYTARRRRSLRPSRQRRMTISSARDCSLLVQIISAHQVADFPLERTRDSDDIAKAAGNNSGKFVFASFQEHSRRTMLAMGRTPRWKETLDFPFLPTLGDFSPTSLMHVSDCLRLSLFSESILTTSAQRSQEMYRDSSTRHKFIGDIEIPFTTLYSNSGVDGYLEGQFRLRTPLITICTGDFQGQSPSMAYESEATSYLHLAVFLRPPLTVPLKEPLVISSLEDERLIRYGASWIQQLRIYFENMNEIIKRPVDGRISKRLVQVFGNNMNGDAVLICRYLSPQAPPPGVSCLNQVARFVSLIPFLEDWKSFGCASLDIWCTSQEFLDVGAGDWEEHGILLHNLIVWLQLKGTTSDSASDEWYLVIGSGLPEGDTVYVMQKRKNLGDDGVSFWNACTGDVFVANHRQSPLIDIGCILTAENIFANTQGDTSPHLLSYNIKDSTIWRPFFQDPSAQRDDWCVGCSCVCNPGPSRIPRPATLASIQDLHLRYDAPNIVHAEHIQVKLTEEIKKSVRRWRMNSGNHRHANTSFNVDISRRLQNLLPALEALQDSGELTGATIQAHKADTLGFTQKMDIEAIAINLPYANTGEILERLRAVNIHNVTCRDVQFIVAAYVHPIINHVCSVWIYYGRVCPPDNKA